MANFFLMRTCTFELRAECAGTFSNINTEQPKDLEDTIAVYWSNEPEEEPPPVYSCVVITNDLAMEGEVPPPEYLPSTTPPRGQNNRNRFESLVRAFGSTIRTVSYYVSRETSSTTHDTQPTRTANENSSHAETTPRTEMADTV